MSLKSKNLPTESWQLVLPGVLHSVRSLLFTATNETPYERFLGFPRQSSTGSSIPSWLIETGSVYVKRNVRKSKFDPLVDEADVLQVNPHYTRIRYSVGRETTVPTRSLAPQGQAVKAQLPGTKLPDHEPKSPNHVLD